MAFFIPVAIIFGLFAVDVGNSYAHKRHLQTQVDAAALAGGTQFKVPCTGPATTSAMVGYNVATVARQYAGPSAAGNTGPYNPQVGATPNSNLHVLLNADAYWSQGNNTEFGTTWGQPCDQGYIDVKATEKDLPWFFGVGSFSTINAEARARFVQTQAEKGFLPLAVPDPKISRATATIQACNASGTTTLASAPLRTRARS